MEYEWDDSKAGINLAKHGMSFDLAEAFEWKTAVVYDDLRSRYGERRHLAYGYVAGRLYVMVYTPRHGKIRVIGLRKANERERKRYETDKKTAAH